MQVGLYGTPQSRRFGSQGQEGERRQRKCNKRTETVNDGQFWKPRELKEKIILLAISNRGGGRT